MLERYLTDLENRLNPETETALEQSWKAFADGKILEGPYKPPRRQPCPPAIEWPDININDAISDDELMLVSQFKMCSDQLAEGSGRLLNVRTNYGVGILPSLFAAEPYIMPREMNCLPNVRPLAGGAAAFERIVANPLPALDQGYAPKIFRVAGLFREIQRQYPHIARHVRIDHPDGQGPFDIVELLWGSDVFYALYDVPDLVHALLDKVVQSYMMFFDAWFRQMIPVDHYHAYACRLHRGLITIRDDSAMNLSPDMCREFIHPYDARLLDHFGGGAIHFCGRGDHHIADMVRASGLSAIDLSQPHLNDMAHVLSQTIDRGINLHTVADASLDELDSPTHAWHRLSIL